MLIRSEQKLNYPKFTMVFVHIWDSLTTGVRVAVFKRNDGKYGGWKDHPSYIWMANDEHLNDPEVAYIQGKLARKFLKDRLMRVNKDTARLVYRWEHPHYGKEVQRVTG